MKTAKAAAPPAVSAPDAEAPAKPPQTPAAEAPDEAGTIPPPPSFVVERTQWHPLADRRTAWLRLEGEDEAREVVEGDVIAGMLVAKIEPSGIVLERNGEQLRRGLGGR